MADLGIQDFLVQQRAKNVKVYERQGRDVHDDTEKSARDLGKARLNHARLNLFTSLGPGDKVDNFKFTVTTEGRLRMGIWPEEGINIRITDSRGKVLGDSNGTEKQQAMFEDIKKSKERVGAGEYFIQVTRADASNTSKEIGYSLQVQIGDQHREDYDTTEYVVDPNAQPQAYDPASEANPTANIRSAEMMATMMGNGLNNLNNIINKTVGIFSTLLNR